MSISREDVERKRNMYRRIAAVLYVMAALLAYHNIKEAYRHDHEPGMELLPK
jgi:hypothetical protein